MSEIKEIQIDRHDSNKYQSTSTSGLDTFAKIHYKDDGSIDEELTYNKYYYAKLHPKEEEKSNVNKETSSSKKSKTVSYSNNQVGKSEKKVPFLEKKIGKLVCTILLVLPIWWIIKCPFSWITYPIRKSVKLANNQGNGIIPSYRFKKNDGCFNILIGTIFLVLPIWWIIKLIGNLLTILPRLLLNNWTVTNDNFWPRYSFYKF